MPLGSVPLQENDEVYVRAQAKHIRNKQATAVWTTRAIVVAASPRCQFFYSVRWADKGLDGCFSACASHA